MRFGVFSSVLFHVCVVGLAFLSLPEGWRPDLESEPYVPIEIISEAELAERTSVPAARPEPEPVKEEPEPDLPAPEEIEAPVPQEEAEPEPEPAPPVVEEEPEPEPEPEPVKPEPEPEPEKPKETPVVKKPEPKNDDLDLDALSALVDKAKDKRPSSSGTPSEVTETADTARRAVGAGDRLTASDISKLRAAVQRCWNASAIIGAPEPEKLKVLVEMRLNRDGTLAGQPRVLNATQIAISGNRFWRVAEQNAVRAVISCQPYDFLSQDRYEDWKEIELNFDPTEMAGF